jgi:hypothetical protein
MNPIIVVSLIGSAALVIQALINYWGNKKTKEEVQAVGKRVDGRMDNLLAAIRAEGVQEGGEQMKARITEEAVRVAGVDLEAAKRAK